jgi:hypothetical protein
MTIRNNFAPSSGTFNGVAAGSDVAGNSLFMGNIAPKVKALSAKVVLDVETDTITISAVWQVSNDNATWMDVANGSQNATSVALGTGTAGADASVTKVMQAPDAVYGWQWARLVFRVGVTTGATADTYSVGYSFRQVVLSAD